MYGKSDYYWLIPLVIVIGFGALLIPLLGTLMTTMLTSGTLTLTAGRRKRSLNQENERYYLFEGFLYVTIVDNLIDGIKLEE